MSNWILDYWLAELQKGKWKWFKNNWMLAFLFFAMLFVLSAGIHALLSLAPNGDPEGIAAVALLIGFLLTSLGFGCYFEQRRLLASFRNALLILRYLDPEGFSTRRAVGIGLPRLRMCALEEYAPNKDVPLGLVLEARGVLDRFVYSSTEEGVGELATLLRREEGSNVGIFLEELDRVVTDNLEEDIKRRFPRQLYYFRLNLLSCFLEAVSQGKHLAFNQQEETKGERLLNKMIEDPQEEAITEFYNIILREFYEHKRDFGPITCDLSGLSRLFSEAGEGKYVWEGPRLLRERVFCAST